MPDEQKINDERGLPEDIGKDSDDKIAA